MKIYINNGVHDRREFLEKHLTERCSELEIIWQTGFQPDHPFVKWLHVYVAPHVDIKALSGFVKLCENFQHALESNEEYFLHADDDVVFRWDWRHVFDLAPNHPINILSLGVNYHLAPDSEYTITGNIGGCECIGVSKQFAEFFLSSIDFNQSTDIVMSSMMVHHFKIPLGVSPMCQQTSLITSSSTGISNYKMSWIEFVKQPYVPTGISYSRLKEMYKNFMEKKRSVDVDFKNRFGLEVDIWNLDYINKRYNVIDK